MVIPFEMDGQLAGLLYLGEKENFDSYSTEDIEYLLKTTGEIKIALINTLMYEMALKGAGIKREDFE